VTESFDSFLARLSSRAASKDAIARGVAIEPYRGAQGDGPATTSHKHILTMRSKRPSRFEIRHRADARVSYIRQPGSLTLVPPGVCPLIRAETEFDFVVCSLDSALVSALTQLLCRDSLRGTDTGKSGAQDCMCPESRLFVQVK
jgi:hypothetical protein